MRGSGRPGQTPAQQQIQQMQERMRDGADWYEQQQARGRVRYDRLGFLGRIARWILALAFNVAAIGLLGLAVFVLVEGDLAIAGGIAVAAVIVFGISNAINGWGRS